MVDVHDDQLDESVRSAYRGAQARDTAAESRVLAKVAEPRHGWWFEPHLFELRPAPVVVLASAMIAVALWAGSRFATPVEKAREHAGASDPVAPGVIATVPASSVPVTFVLRTSDAARVNLVGDFNSWDAEATPLRHDGSRDLWVVELELPRGMHNYAFVVDGSDWRPDPSAPLAADATYGGRTSVLVVESAGL